MSATELKDKIKDLRQQAGLTMRQLADAVNVSEATVSRWESGNISNMRRDKIYDLAKALNTTPAYLMGWEEPPVDDYSHIKNIMPVPKMKKLPLIGQIACGTPILAEENITDYIDAPGHIRADFALTCKGDSMINAGIKDGDVVYIRQQPSVENGEIAAVMVGDDEATLKRFYFVDNVITLNAENPTYLPMSFIGEEISKIRVIGLAVAFLHHIV